MHHESWDKLYPFQREGVKKLNGAESALIADDMGLLARQDVRRDSARHRVATRPIRVQATNAHCRSVRCALEHLGSGDS